MADLHQPHDKFFQAIFSDTGEAAGLLRATLPSTLSNGLDWTTLTLRRGTFIDEHLRISETDLLYQAEHTETRQPVSLYLLLEHQSSPDPWLRLRLLRYCCRIWEADRQSDPGRAVLQPIVPVVFYQGPRGWNHSTAFADLFPEAVRSWPWVPRFVHELLDQTTLEPGAVAGGVKGRMAQLLLMAAFDRHAAVALQLAEHLALLLVQAGGGVGVLRPFMEYLAATQERAAVETFDVALQRRGLEQGGDMMTYAEELLAEGRAEGEARGRAEGRIETQVEVVEGLLGAGVPWNVIGAATGLTETKFQELKARLSDSSS